ncbi:hypothetical protein Trco_007360 [Trichoderma cornu-damae]|uniref:Uncharacterized protein n=1 Tax=Trichoderma cornu-damae TaxID=654480 RepID=A0A9P8QFX6_9HYPO|nr:hypothetical protein Trco_007360 [Trichoderma cornu-damae]
MADTHRRQDVGDAPPPQQQRVAERVRQRQRSRSPKLRIIARIPSPLPLTELARDFVAGMEGENVASPYATRVLEAGDSALGCSKTSILQRDAQSPSSTPCPDGSCCNLADRCGYGPEVCGPKVCVSQLQGHGSLRPRQLRRQKVSCPLNDLCLGQSPEAPCQRCKPLPKEPQTHAWPRPNDKGGDRKVSDASQSTLLLHSPGAPDRGGRTEDTGNYVALVRENASRVWRSLRHQHSYPNKLQATGICVGSTPRRWRRTIRRLFRRHELRFARARAREGPPDWPRRLIANWTSPLYYDKLDPAKLNMGLAYYARGFTVASPNCNGVGCDLGRHQPPASLHRLWGCHTRPDDDDGDGDGDDIPPLPIVTWRPGEPGPRCKKNCGKTLPPVLLLSLSPKLSRLRLEFPRSPGAGPENEEHEENERQCALELGLPLPTFRPPADHNNHQAASAAVQSVARAGPRAAQAESRYRQVHCYNGGQFINRGLAIEVVDCFCDRFQGQRTLPCKHGVHCIPGNVGCLVDVLMSVTVKNGCRFTMEGKGANQDRGRILRLMIDECDTSSTETKQGGTLSRNCADWGFDPSNRWGSSGNAC